MPMKKKWSREKINDKFSTRLKADGTPMSRQQIHMLRKKAQGLCLTCGEPAVGVYCLKHTIAARERMRKKLKYQRRLHNSSSYLLEKEVKTSKKTKAPAKKTVAKKTKTTAKRGKK
jgi:hypothetical protein